MNTPIANQALSHEQLPHVLDLTHLPLDKQYASVNRLLGLVSTFILAVIIGVIYFQPFFPLPEELHLRIPFILWALVSISLFITWYKFAADKRKFYALRELDIHYISGLIFCKIVSQPITRIQHVELKRGPIERRLGLASLQVFSAGGEMHTFEIPGLPVDTATKIRHFILQHKAMLTHG